MDFLHGRAPNQSAGLFYGDRNRLSAPCQFRDKQSAMTSMVAHREHQKRESALFVEWVVIEDLGIVHGSVYLDFWIAAGM